jgi:outer membrane protein OmpA-like peptidoglycan-associated protein
MDTGRGADRYSPPPIPLRTGTPSCSTGSSGGGGGGGAVTTWYENHTPINTSPLPSTTTNTNTPNTGPNHPGMENSRGAAGRGWPVSALRMSGTVGSSTAARIVTSGACSPHRACGGGVSDIDIESTGAVPVEDEYPRLRSFTVNVGPPDFWGSPDEGGRGRAMHHATPFPPDRPGAEMWWWAATAAAQVSFEVVSRVAVGDAATLRFLPAAEGRILGQVACGGRAPVQISANLKPGTPHVVTLAGLPEGSHPCQGTVRLETPDGGSAELPLSFTVEVRSPLQFQVSPGDWDREAHTLVIHPSRPLKAAVARVIGIGGREIDGGPAVLADPLAPRFAFGTTEEVLQIQVEAQDDAGVRALLTLSPWFYAIPHDDVVFASGSSVITPEEEPKLARVWTDVRGVLDKYGSVVQIRLYVAGYTDTVGSAESNRALSRSRAKAIASWFARQGFPGEVWWQGFGEDVLAVPTPDETDASPNRRALYLLAADAPPASRDLPSADWVRLR